MSNLEHLPAGEAAAYRQGWRTGLAFGALAIAVTAFINLLSVEKSILALVLGAVALYGAGAGVAGRARWAIGIAVLHLVVVTAALLLFHDKLARLLSLLQSLG